MRVLLHVCCGPCAIAPAKVLLQEGYELTGWFYNPNIHPLAEYLRRREGARQTAAALDFPLLFPQDAPECAREEYNVQAWCGEALAHPQGRCVYCRESRFAEAARTAKKLGFDAFTSSLLYSRHQDHAGMKDAGEKAAAAYGVSFLYRDFRPFWQDGITASKELGIYRQQYCGCVFSEQERYAKELAKALAS